MRVIIIGNGIKNIDDLAFYVEESDFEPNNKSLEDVYCYAKEVPTIGYEVFAHSSDVILHVPKGSVGEYQKADVWKDFKDIMAIGLEDPDPTGVISARNGDAVLDLYSLDGIKQTKLGHGINIIRCSDGKTKKVFVK